MAENEGPAHRLDGPVGQVVKPNPNLAAQQKTYGLKSNIGRSRWVIN